jgi:hypothetical protein
MELFRLEREAVGGRPAAESPMNGTPGAFCGSGWAQASALGVCRPAIKRGNDASVGTISASNDRRPAGPVLARAHSGFGDIFILANGMSAPPIERREGY